MILPIKDLILKLKNIQDNLDRILLDSSSIMALDAVGLSEMTILEKGFGAMYSEKYIPSYFMEGKQLNASGLSYLESVNDNPEGGANWKGFRKAQGLQTGFVDLSYSRNMWQGLRPSDPQNEGTRYFCLIGHNNAEGAKTMDYNFKRYGDFIGKGLEGQEDLLREVATENLKLMLDEL